MIWMQTATFFHCVFYLCLAQTPLLHNQYIFHTVILVLSSNMAIPLFQAVVLCFSLTVEFQWLETFIKTDDADGKYFIGFICMRRLVMIHLVEAHCRILKTILSMQVIWVICFSIETGCALRTKWHCFVLTVCHSSYTIILIHLEFHSYCITYKHCICCGHSVHSSVCYTGMLCWNVKHTNFFTIW